MGIASSLFAFVAAAIFPAPRFHPALAGQLVEPRLPPPPPPSCIIIREPPAVHSGQSTAPRPTRPDMASDLPVSRKATKPYSKPRHFQPLVDLKVVSAAKAVDYLIEYMNAEGHIGLFAAREIDEAWRITCALYDLLPLDANMVREALDGRGLRLGKKRLNTPEYAQVKLRTGADRLILYRIPRCKILAERSPAVPELSPDLAPGSPTINPARTKVGPVKARSKDRQRDRAKDRPGDRGRDHLPSENTETPAEFSEAA